MSKQCCVCTEVPAQENSNILKCCRTEFCMECAEMWYIRRTEKNLIFNCPACRTVLTNLSRYSFIKEPSILDTLKKLQPDIYSSTDSLYHESEDDIEMYRDEDEAIDYYNYEGPEYEAEQESMDEFLNHVGKDEYENSTTMSVDQFLNYVTGNNGEYNDNHD